MNTNENDLMRRLATAKKIMNKVDNGDYQKGNIDESILLSDPENLVQNLPNNTVPKNIKENINVDKINNSKLPDVIKQAMIERPIQQISLNETIDMKIVDGAKKLMEREGMISNKKESHIKSNNNFNNNDLINVITPIIENTIRKVLDEKLNQLLTTEKNTTLNENLVLKVGDSIFSGKITNVKKSK